MRKKESGCCLGSPLAGFGPPVPAGGRARFRSAALGAVLLAFLPRRRLEFAVSFASFVSSLPVLGAVSSVVRPVSAPFASLRGVVPRSSVSGVVSVVSVVRGEDRVSVVCSDGRVRVCRVAYASRALGRPVSVDAVFARLSARVGSEVRFLAAFGYSADAWFVACEGV